MTQLRTLFLNMGVILSLFGCTEVDNPVDFQPSAKVVTTDDGGCGYSILWDCQANTWMAAEDSLWTIFYRDMHKEHPSYYFQVQVKDDDITIQTAVRDERPPKTGLL